MTIDKHCPVCRITFRVAPAHAHRVCCSLACAQIRRDQQRLPPAEAAARSRECKRSYVARRRAIERSERSRPCTVCGFASVWCVSSGGTCSTTCAAVSATKRDAVSA